MLPDNAIEMTIRNHRYTRWTVIAVVSMVGTFFSGLFALLVLDASGLVVFLVVLAIAVSLAGAVGLGLFAPHIITGVKLTEVLQPRPGGPEYQPIDIARIDFASDPHEDFDDAALPIRMCEIRLRPVHRFAIRLIASVGDGRRLWDWAVRNGVDVFDPTNVLNRAFASGSG